MSCEIQNLQKIIPNSFLDGDGLFIYGLDEMSPDPVRRMTRIDVMLAGPDWSSEAKTMGHDYRN